MTPRTREDWRRYFAAHAPPVPRGFPLLLDSKTHTHESELEQTIRWRVEYADLMLAALKILQ